MKIQCAKLVLQVVYLAPVQLIVLNVKPIHLSSFLQGPVALPVQLTPNATYHSSQLLINFAKSQIQSAVHVSAAITSVQKEIVNKNAKIIVHPASINISVSLMVAKLKLISFHHFKFAKIALKTA